MPMRYKTVVEDFEDGLDSGAAPSRFMLITGNVTLKPSSLCQELEGLKIYHFCPVPKWQVCYMPAKPVWRRAS